MRKIEDRNNEMVDQIRLLINKSFPPALGYRVEYFVGEDEDTRREHLVFNLTSSMFGNIYCKSLKLSPEKPGIGVESDFIGALLTDFTLLAVTFLTNNVMHSKTIQREDADNLVKHPFSKGRLKNLNLN
ncbi:hypothetical protein KAR91_09395 [Candidatus Pacearchaeota archaeon]|nr:hypothetical protein [Candidatus Pacearchaeota archaeon]